MCVMKYIYCVLCIPIIPNESLLNTCDACVLTTWRLGISIQKDVKAHFGSFVSKPSGNILYVMFDKYFVT